ncbi:GIN domain-containing protein [Aquimarina latercula]|uniref:GIN domain-containing protein n=1 Tax=Aquimarina latercula TaxID=987 RepID=UPI00042A4CE9|nr:DUF2807 domain-containing protein [Aquimarina latercula]
MKGILFILIFMIVLNISAQESKFYSSYSELGTIRSIEVSDNLSVFLYPSSFNGISIRCDKRLKDIVKSDFQNNRLKLYTLQKNSYANTAEIIIYLKSVKELKLYDQAIIKSKKAIISDTLKINVLEKNFYDLISKTKVFSFRSNGTSEGDLNIESNTADFELNGSTMLHATLKADQVTIEQSDNAIVELIGETKLLEAEINNTSILRARNLKAEEVIINSFNSSAIQLYAKNKLTIQGKGNAKVYVSGNPKKIDTLSMNKKTKIIF